MTYRETTSKCAWNTNPKTTIDIGAINRRLTEPTQANSRLSMLASTSKKAVALNAACRPHVSKETKIDSGVENPHPHCLGR